MSTQIMFFLRAIHILSGVFWAGTAIAMAFIITPSIVAAGPAGGQVMQQVSKRGFTQWMSIAAGSVLLTGLIMYGVQPAQNAVLNIGALAATIGFVFGIVIGRTSKQMGALGGQIAAGGKPPTPEQGAEMGALQGKLVKLGRYNAALLIIAVLGMGVAQYSWFAP